MDDASFEAHLKRLQAEADALSTQLKWMYRFSIALIVVSLPCAYFSLWFPVGGLFFGASLAGIAYYIATVHMQSTRERISDLEAQRQR